MRRVFKIVLLLLLVVLLAAVAAAAALLKPTYTLPPEGKAAIDARMAEYRKIADRVLLEMRRRPPEDAQAFEALVKELGPATEEEKKSPPVRNTCPAYDQQTLASGQPHMQTLLKWEERIRAIVDDGLVLRKPDGYWEENLRSTLRFMYVFQWNEDLAVLSLQQGRNEEAVRRLLTGLRVAEGYYQTTFPHGGVSLENQTGLAIIHLLPRLAPADLDRLKTALQGLPDPREQALKVDIVELAEMLNTAEHLPRLMRELNDEDAATPAAAEALSWQEDFDHWLAGRQAERSGASGVKSSPTLIDRFIERQWYILQSIRLREVDSDRAWLAAGGDGEYHAYNDPEDWERVVFPPFQLVMMSKAFRLGPSVKTWQQRQSLLRAIDAELKRRADGGSSFELPYDSKSHIVVNAEYGCVVANERNQPARSQ